MKIIKPCLFGLACLTTVIASLGAVAEEFTCEAGQSNCLYDAIAAANQTSGADTIRFTEGAHFSSAVYPSRCAPSIEGEITIVGASRVDTHLIAEGSCAYFHVAPGGSLTLQDIVIADGKLDGLEAGSGEVQRGAAIYNEGTLNVARTIFRGNSIANNSAKLSGGGAIYNAPGANAFIGDVEFFSNSIAKANYGGAAILNEGDMKIIHSRFFFNTGFGGIIANGVPGASTMASLILADSVIVSNTNSTGIRNGLMGFAQLLIERTTIRDGNGGEGGGIYNGGELTVRESSLVQNTAAKGGGIYSAKGSRSTFINSTISKNYAAGTGAAGIGGGIYNNGGAVFLASSTIASNTSQGFGSAIAVTSDVEGTAQVFVKGSLIVGHANTRQYPACYDFGANDARKLFLAENNLVTAQSNCYLPSETDIVVNETDSFTNVLGPLSDYGSLTPSYALLRGSPAIDSGDNLCTDFDGMPIVIDQRGNERTGCDKGSVDADAKSPPVQIQLVGANSIQPNSTSTIDLHILSRSDSTSPFRPTKEVDRSTIRFGSAGALPVKTIIQDVNSDGIDDWVIRFKISSIGIACGDTSVELKFATFVGTPFVSSADIVTTGCQ
ncbi:MAG: right-handed parallel beta-helix repeat-containing protein [Gammaproteobacteria bacterium]|nr:MAG: right-handed parallel beta-helix repeat-containing protein [Gammaproteobacteria bacterium]